MAEISSRKHHWGIWTSTEMSKDKRKKLNSWWWHCFSSQLSSLLSPPSEGQLCKLVSTPAAAREGRGKEQWHHRACQPFATLLPDEFGWPLEARLIGHTMHPLPHCNLYLGYHLHFDRSPLVMNTDFCEGQSCDTWRKRGKRAADVEVEKDGQDTDRDAGQMTERNVTNLIGWRMNRLRRR